MKQTKLNKAKQANGQVDTQPTTLNQIWGDDGLSKYGTFNLEEYTVQLTEMNKSDLFAHAAKLGVMPIDNRERLVKTLVKSFKEYCNSYHQPKFIAPKLNVTKEIAKILSEGR